MTVTSEQRLKGARVLVVGMARSGTAAARLAKALGARVTTTDLRSGIEPVPGCRAVHGRHDPADFRQAQVVIVSPGVPASAPLLAVARDNGARVLGELGFAAGLLPDLPQLCITGTNGKSSTTHFLGQLLAAAGRRPFVGGNLGTPLSTLVLDRLQGRQQDIDCVVLEVSSYQLEHPQGLAPRAAAILNLTPDHLGRHGDMAGYGAAKRRLLQAVQPDGSAWLPRALSALAPDTGVATRWLDDHPGVRPDGDRLVLAGTCDDGDLSLADLRLLGAHNRKNVAAAVALAVSAGVPRADLHLDRLTALAHRLQLVPSSDGLRWVDDSKATNVDAALAGIAGLPDARIVLLGGQGKDGADYTDLLPHLDGRTVICFGASGEEIADALAARGPRTVAGLAQAVALARDLAAPGDTVLLSPACASFDEFDDFEHRGRVFAALAAGDRAATKERP